MGAEHESNIGRSTGLALSEHRLLPAGHALKVKEFTVSLLWPENDVSGLRGHYFAIDPGASNFHCELELPGFSATGEGGKQLTPAAGEWSGKLTTRGLNVTVVAPDTPRTGLRADVQPKRTRHFNDQYSAVAVQSEKDVNFVLIYPGFISTGMSDSVSGSGANTRWSFEGHLHLVDPEKTKAGGRNVDRRKIAVKYTSDAPTKLFLDGKAYELAAPGRATAMGALDMPGRIFVLRDEGEPLQTARTLALSNGRNLKDSKSRQPTSRS